MNAVNGNSFDPDGNGPIAAYPVSTPVFRYALWSSTSTRSNAKMERVTVKDGNKPMFIVDDVDSVTTGVKNVDFTVVNRVIGGNTGANADNALIHGGVIKSDLGAVQGDVLGVNVEGGGVSVHGALGNLLGEV